MHENTSAAAQADAGLHASGGMMENIVPSSMYYAICRDPQGNIKWVEEVPNLVTNAGKDHLLDVVFKGGTQVTTWYVGIKGSGSPAAGDTHASHAGWTELTTYTESPRPTWTGSAVSGQSTTNSASKARFTANATMTVAGAFLASISTKGSTAAGILYNVADFSVARSMASGDTLDVTDTLSIT